MLYVQKYSAKKNDLRLVFYFFFRFIFCSCFHKVNIFVKLLYYQVYDCEHIPIHAHLICSLLGNDQLYDNFFNKEKPSTRPYIDKN